MKIFDKVEDLIGKTPLLEVKNFSKQLGLNAKILVKLEYFNPTGSVKDRTALFMLNRAEKEGLIKEGATIIEPTSGNTGIGLASICASRGYKLILTMPETMSIERIKLIKGYGAQVVLTDGKLGMKGAVEKANELKEQIKGSFIPSQFDNFANIDAHYFTTGREIWQDTDGKVDVFIAGIGTGGTLSGTAKYLKEQNKDIKVVVLTSHNDEKEVLNSIKAGANAYCSKEINPQRLVEVVKSVLDGAAWFDPAISHIVLNAFTTTQISDVTPIKTDYNLTTREAQILKLITEGYSNTDIASELVVSVNTTKAHVASILQKLEVEDRLQAALKAIKNKIV